MLIVLSVFSEAEKVLEECIKEERANLLRLAYTICASMKVI